MRETVAERCLHSLSLSYPKTKTIYLFGKLAEISSSRDCSLPGRLPTNCYAALR